MVCARYRWVHQLNVGIMQVLIDIEIKAWEKLNMLT